MKKTDSKTKSKKSKFKKILLYGSLSLIVILVISHFIWKSSGSGQWELKKDKDGVKVYCLKSSGSTLIKCKSIGQIPYHTLAGIVKLMRDPDVCEDVGCYDSYIIESPGPELIYYTFKMDFFFPLKAREYVVKSEYYQNPETKEILVNFIAAPDKLPPNDCCVRVLHMKNTWRFTPLDNGMAEVEFVFDEDEGGNFPYFLANLFAPILASAAITELPELLQKEKFLNAKLDYVEEFNNT